MKNKSRRKNRSSKQKLGMLLSAALALPGVMPKERAHAQESLQAPVLRLKYGEYGDFQDSDHRMKVHAPMFQFQAPLTEGLDLEVGGMWESMSGASPLYLSTMSGASQKGIADHRLSTDLRITKYFERFSIAGGGTISDEDDYSSKGASGEVKLWSPNKNTIVAVGAGTDWDDISSTNDPAIDESRRTLNTSIGVTQVIDPISTAQCNITYSAADGFLDDVYKTFDHRPRSRDMWAWLLRYVRYLEETEGSIHLDARLYRDSWNVLSETAELSYYQPLESGWMIVPNVRYYSQDEAEFFHGGRLPFEAPESFFSADQRLSSFGEWGTGFKILKEFSEKLSVDLRAQIFHQRSGFHLGGSGEKNVEPFTGFFVIAGLSKKF